MIYLTEQQEKIWRMVQANPGITTRDLTTLAGISYSSIYGYTSTAPEFKCEKIDQKLRIFVREPDAEIQRYDAYGPSRHIATPGSRVHRISNTLINGDRGRGQVHGVKGFAYCSSEII